MLCGAEQKNNIFALRTYFKWSKLDYFHATPSYNILKYCNNEKDMLVYCYYTNSGQLFFVHFQCLFLTYLKYLKKIYI